MKLVQPPRAAKWLITHFGSSSNNAQLIGDLDERFQHGRTAAWYWRQVIFTIVVSLVNEVWRHKSLTLRALSIGWIIFVASRSVYSATYQLFFGLAMWSKWWRHEWIPTSVQAVEVLVAGILSGWLIARFHRKNQRAMVLAYATSAASVHYGSLLIALLSRPVGPADNVILFTLLLTVGTLIGGGLFSSPATDNAAGHHATA
jgi:hypothetical protein